jgi:hypothetical protein
MPSLAIYIAGNLTLPLMQVLCDCQDFSKKTCENTKVNVISNEVRGEILYIMQSLNGMAYKISPHPKHFIPSPFVRNDILEYLIKSPQTKNHSKFFLFIEKEILHYSFTFVNNAGINYKRER